MLSRHSLLLTFVLTILRQCGAHLDGSGVYTHTIDTCNSGTRGSAAVIHELEDSSSQRSHCRSKLNNFLRTPHRAFVRNSSCTTVAFLLRAAAGARDGGKKFPGTYIGGLDKRGGGLGEDHEPWNDKGNAFFQTKRTIKDRFEGTAANFVCWLVIVGTTIGWAVSRPPESSGVVQKALVGAIIASTSIQAASNVCASNQYQLERHQDRRGNLMGLKKFRWIYLGVLSACNLAEFVQGAYLYKVYEVRGFNMGTIAKMFLASTLTAMMTGMFAGAFLDRYGRRNGCMLWALLNAFQCFLIRSRNFTVLLLGRIVAGAAAALLATSFECWMVTEHHKRGHPSGLLPETFRMATWSTGLVTVASGFLAGSAVERGWGIMAPFDLAIVVSLAACVLMGQFWPENHGDRSFSASHNLLQAIESIVGDGRLLMMGIVQALFEGVMLTWIVMWVPSLDMGEMSPFNLGIVFSALMISLCGGSALFKLLTEGLSERFAISAEACLVIATGMSCIALGASAAGLRSMRLLLMFFIYEACMGLYFPAMATCRSKYIQDGIRGTVMNIFRVPMNLLVAVLMLGPVGNSTLSIRHKVPVVFGILSGLTGIATLVQMLLLQREREQAATMIAQSNGDGVNAYNHKGA